MIITTIGHLATGPREASRRASADRRVASRLGWAGHQEADPLVEAVLVLPSCRHGVASFAQGVVWNIQAGVFRFP